MKGARPGWNPDRAQSGSAIKPGSCEAKDDTMASRPYETPEQEIRLEAAREALKRHRSETGASWSRLEKLIGRDGATLSAFANNTYAGNNVGVAEQIETYFRGITAQREVMAAAPKVPGWTETSFAADMMATLRFAQSGEIVAVSAAPGCGKSLTAAHYMTQSANVWMATMSRSCARLQPMQTRVLQAMGEASPKGSPLQLSQQIMAKMANSGGLLIIDEFHELTDDAVEEIRSWYDATGCGIAFVGDYRVISSIEGRREQRTKAQIFSRVTKRLVRHQASGADADVLLDAWGVTDEAARRFARSVATKPGALRSRTKMLKLAAFVSETPGALTLDDLRSARGQLTSTLEA
jgi:DNA transposition AAA+ family ATPase